MGLKDLLHGIHEVNFRGSNEVQLPGKHAKNTLAERLPVLCLQVIAFGIQRCIMLYVLLHVHRFDTAKIVFR